MGELEYRRLVAEEALRAGVDPEEAFAEFESVIYERSNHIEAGTKLQAELDELSRHYDFHLKSTPLPEGVAPLSMKRLKSKWGFLSNQRRRENEGVVVLTNKANRMLGDSYLRTPSHPKRGASDAQA